MKTHRRPGHPGHPAFTLIELMAVITITVILAALIVAGVNHATQKQASEKATLQLARLTAGLEEYKQDMGTYPVSANTSDGLGQSDKCLYQALFYEGYDYARQTPPPANWTKATRIYVSDLDPTSSRQDWVTPVTGSTAVPPASAMVIDPWGNEYRYRSAKNATGAPNTSTINPEFDLWSSGKDANSNPGTPSAPVNRDDLRNFSPPAATPLHQPVADIVTGQQMLRH